MLNQLKLLAIDTSAAASSCAIWLDDLCYSRQSVLPRSHSSQILPMVNELLSTHNLKLNDFSALVLSVGPGSFTGVKCAAAVMQAWSLVYSLPIIAVSSLQIRAQAAYALYGFDHLIVAIDAKMNELYVGKYAVDNFKTMQPQCADSLIKSTQLFELQLADTNYSHVVGDEMLIDVKYAFPYALQNLNTHSAGAPVYLREKVVA